LKNLVEPYNSKANR